MLLSLLWLAGCAARPGLQNQLEDEIVALQQRMVMLEQELAGCGDPNAPNTLYARLIQVFSGSDIELELQGSKTVIILPASQLFTDAFGDGVRDEADMSLDLLATALLLNPDYDITVVGHTGSTPIPPANAQSTPNHVAWSLQLAMSLTEHLIQHYEVPPNRFTIAGRGSRAPRGADGADHINHRVELHLVRSIQRPDTPSGP